MPKPESAAGRRSSAADAVDAEEEKSSNRFEAKWGQDIAKTGYTMIPNILIEKQHALGLTPPDLNLLLVLLKYWWKVEDLPYPSKATIAESMNVTPRTVQRSIARLRESRLIETKKRPGTTGTNEYSFQGLIDVLIPHARDALEQREEHKAQRRQQRLRKRARATLRNEDAE